MVTAPAIYWGSGTFLSNVILLRTNRRGALRTADAGPDTPAAFFARIGALCLRTKWLSAQAETRHLKCRRGVVSSEAAAAIEAVYVFAQLMRRVPNAALRQDCRRRVAKVLALHYDRLIQQVAAGRAGCAPDINDARAADTL
jgi:hypothetical protein